MAERVYPTSKTPVSTGGKPLNGVAGAKNTQFPPTKSQLYGTARPTYRPQPPRRHRRSCCCRCCLWLALFIFILLLLAAAAGAIFWALFRPQRPDFSVAAFKISQFALTPSSQLNFKSVLTVTARNPNKKIEFLYDPITLAVSSNGVAMGSGSFPAFDHGTKNVTALKAAISSSAQSLDDGSVNTLKSDLKGRRGMPLVVQLETKVGLKIGGVKTKKMKIRVVCDGIRATAPTGKSPSTATTAGAKCDVDLRVKIWKWTF